MRKVPFVEKEYYHIYNRAVEKRPIFSDEKDLQRFFQSMCEFNTVEPIGSIFENVFKKEKAGNSPLVEFVAFCLNPNHFHFILTQVAERGIEKFMHRLGTGYTKYFNEKYLRSGALFQGRFKSNHISSNGYLLHASVYVNLNFKVHKLNKKDFYYSSWDEFINPKISNFCSKNIILGQFRTVNEYKKYAEDTLSSIIERKDLLKELENVPNLRHLEVQLPSI